MSHKRGPSSFIRVNGRIRAREVRVVGIDGNQLGVFQLNDALALARRQDVDLVEIAPTATPPVCRLVDYGKFRYEQSKKEKESRRHQHANRVKEVQLTATIDPHDFTVKLDHAIEFLCDEMKVKLTLRFRGREMAHKQYGFQVMERFISELVPYGHPDSASKLEGRRLIVMLSPLPRNKRAKNPNQAQDADSGSAKPQSSDQDTGQPSPDPLTDQGKQNPNQANPAGLQSSRFANSPFTELDVSLQD